MEYRVKNFTKHFTEKAGKVLHVPDDNEYLGGRDVVLKHVKFKIEIDLTKPIVPGWTLDRGLESPIWIDFKFENFQTFASVVESLIMKPEPALLSPRSVIPSSVHGYGRKMLQWNGSGKDEDLRHMRTIVVQLLQMRWNRRLLSAR